MNNRAVNTTPYIDNLENVKNMGLVVSVGTASFNADVSLPTGTAFFPDTDYRAFKNPTLFSIAKYNGYKTTIIDATSSNFPNIVIRKSDLEDVDKLITEENIGFDEEFIDISAARYINNLLKTSSGNFVVLYKKGSHFHYESTYPNKNKDFIKFLPKLKDNDPMGSKIVETRNSYKNSIYFNVDYFFEMMLPKEFRNTTIVYTSDHGQSLQENGVRYTHGKTEIHQALVPWFFVSDHKWFNDTVFKNKSFEKSLLSHHHLYPSIAALLFDDREYSNGEYHSVFERDFDRYPYEEKYVVGNFWINPQIFDIDYAKAKKALEESEFK